MNDIRFALTGDARRAHLALVDGGAATNKSVVGATNSADEAAPLKNTSVGPARGMRNVSTSLGSPTVEAARSRHETGVRAVAQKYATFEDALLPMVLASGVSGEAAGSVADAIMGNPALKAQAERAFKRARMTAV